MTTIAGKKKKALDFESLVKAHGFARARQLIKITAIEEHQEHVEKTEKKINEYHQPTRKKELLMLSTTAGPVASISLLEKIVHSNTSINSLEEALRGSSAEQIKLLRSIKEREKPIAHGPDLHKFVENYHDKYSMQNERWQILAPNSGIDEFPPGLADTLHLQTRYLREINVSRNDFRTFISLNMPQLAVNHFMYVRVINLNLNKLSRLPDNFGILKYLEELHLSGNQLSKLPSSFSSLHSLHTLDLSRNVFCELPQEFACLINLTSLDLSENLFISFPYAVSKLFSIKTVKIARNPMTTLCIFPPFLKVQDMFVPMIDGKDGKSIFMNILTREKVSHIERFTNHLIERTRDLHVFQQQGTKSYRRRKMWLSICHVHEWEPDIDPITGTTYYRNNVSGETSWDMPVVLDTIGIMETIEELVIKGNAIKSFPSSFTKLLRLKKVIASKNRISVLPEDFGNLQELQTLELSSNELKILPVNICSCKALEVLSLDDNHLIRLPEELGSLPNLRYLNVTANRMKAMPFSLGYCRTLKQIFVTDNPMEDPPIAEFDKDIETVLWYLRNRALITKNGMPPQMEFHGIGVQEEVLILKPELSITVRNLVEAAKKTGFLNLQLLGLRDIPPDVELMNPFKNLKMDFNENLRLPSAFPPYFSKLKVLTFKSCRMPTFPENLYIFQRLLTLNLEENRLEFLPDSICEITSLTNLNLSKNCLYCLPDDFYHLNELQTLNLESNYMESFPLNFEKLAALKVLNIAKNRINDVPQSLCSLAVLTSLNLEKNKLMNIPVKMRHLGLIELNIGHNMIEILAEDMFAFEMGKSIRHFSCVENNIMELPASLILMDPNCVFEADYNPLMSPPPYLLAEGFRVVQNYMAIRQARRKLLLELMLEEDFELYDSSFGPIACDVLEDGTGFLTPEDMASFDCAVQEYVNFEYYKCPATGEELVQRIVTLREERETQLYLTILRTFLSLLKQLKKDEDPRFTDANVFTVQKPWGRNGELCYCLSVSLAALLRESPPTVFYPEGRPSLFNLIGQKLPPISFPFTVDLLKDSIRLYVSPYGPIAATEQVVFPQCDCVDDKKGKPKRHEACTKPGVVICKSVYVEEEADRREIEEDEYLERFEAVEDDVLLWLVTQEGKRGVEREVKRRKKALKENIELREEMMVGQQMKLKKANEKLTNLQSRKGLFDAGASIDMHGFYSEKDAIKAISAAEADVANFTSRIEVLQEMIAELKAKYAIDHKSCCVTAAGDLIQKYCVKSYNESVYRFRKTAALKDLNRHWDGDDGDAFEDWLSKHTIVKMDNGEAEIKDEEGVDQDAQRPQTSSSTRPGTSSSGKQGELAPEYDWEGTDDMQKLHLNLFSRYRNTHQLSYEP